MANTNRKAFILAHPNTSAKDLVILAAKKGIRLSTRWIYDVRGPQKKAKAKPSAPPKRVRKAHPRPVAEPQQTQEQQLMELSFLLGLTRAKSLLEILRENANRVVLG